MEITLECQAQRVETLVVAPIENELVLLDVDNGNYYGLDPVASWIWERLEEPQGVALLAQAVTERFDVDLDTATRDLLAFLTELADQAMVRISA
jgi:hypothetical protein